MAADAPSITDLSRRLLGGDHRLVVAAAIAAQPPGAFRTAVIVQACPDLDPTVVSKELAHFRRARLLAKVSHGQHERRYPDLWRGLGQLAEDLLSPTVDEDLIVPDDPNGDD
jgi:hypothetical protein